jgi:hypothetical protein
MKFITLLVSLAILSYPAFAGPGVADKTITTPSVTLSPYAANEFNISLLGSGSWTITNFENDRYFGVDHTYGGTLAANYFFAKYFGVGLSFSGDYVRNLSTPARVATSNDQRRFVGDLLANVTLRYPIGTSPFSPYVRVGAGAIFNGGNKQLQSPDGSIGQQIRFAAVQHDAQMIGEGALGIEYRITHNIGIISEASFDKVTRPQSNFLTGRVGVNVAF